MTEDQLRTAMNQNKDFRDRQAARNYAHKIREDVSQALGDLLIKWAHHGMTVEEMRKKLQLAFHMVD